MVRALIVSTSLVLLSTWCDAAVPYSSKAWQSLGKSYTFPEQDYAEIAVKENVGITFSGGGDRAYLAAIGYLAAFHELGFVGNVKYIAGSSGMSDYCNCLLIVYFVAWPFMMMMLHVMYYLCI
jgi:hypothetical protein